ncbi:flagellar hook assembly protein FlgD [Novosphingobium sp.]|uniref:flagellar hook assembly protein FlgD n=1 Tax=Novosphingobium sp. TaxID=1874826 RepID=UPI002B461F9A|nr:flagellar hook capping FlgD N-terminal domain-containing protein [Novosphingobium sp.]HKR91737.1 flagellar hook capping FlgD N-terminal domain-containing protein [Novosphingobium sp.]
MTVTSINSTSPTAGASTGPKTSLSSLDSGDFLKLMLAQMQQQDPTNPVDQKEMLAQMAQFSQLSSSTKMSDTLTTISSKLDTLVSSQNATQQAISTLAASIAASNAGGAQPAA